MAPITLSPAPAAATATTSESASQHNWKPTTATTATTNTPTPPTSATTPAPSSATADPSPWPQIEQNYFTSMQQHRAHEDATLAAAHRAHAAPLRQRLLENFKAQEEILRRLRALRAEYDSGQAELEGLERDFESQGRERAARRGKEDEERRAWFERYRRGGLAYRGGGGEEREEGGERAPGGEEERERRDEREDERYDERGYEGQRQDDGPEGERWDEGATGHEGQHDYQEDVNQEADREQPDTAAEEGRPTNRDGSSHGKYQLAEADQQTPYAPAVTNGHEGKAPVVETTVAAEPPNGHQNEEPEESRVGDDRTTHNAVALASGQQEEPQGLENEIPDAGTLGNNKESETPTAENGVTETVPIDDDTEMGGVEGERRELPQDNQVPTADRVPGSELPKPGQQTHTPAPTTSHEASSAENTQQPTTEIEMPDETVVPRPTGEDVEMPDVQGAAANAAVEVNRELETPAEIAQPAATYPSSSSDLSSRDTTPELGTPVSMTRDVSPPATPGETTDSDLVDVLDEAGDLIGRLRASGTGNSVMDRFSRLPIKRPVQVRPGRKFTADDLDSLPRPPPGDARPNKFLSFFVQAMGEVQARPCQDCSSNHGPYQGCVMVGGDPDFARCGNCEWNKRGCHGSNLERPSSSRHSNSNKSPTKSPGKVQTPGTSFTAANKTSASYEDRTGGDEADHSDAGPDRKETAPKKAPRKSLPGSRKTTTPSTPSAKPAQAEADDLPEINKEVLCLKDDGVVFTDPPMMRGVPLAKISPDHPYWEPDWKPIEELVEPLRLKHQEKYDQLDQAGSTHRDKHLANRDAKRGRTVLKFLEEGELHPYQLVGKKWINYRITNYDTLFRLAQLLTEELPRMGLDVSPSEWLRHRLHELYVEKGDKFDVASWIGKAYHDRKIEQLRMKNGFPRVGRPPAHATRNAEPSSSTKKPPRSLKRKDPHQTPESTPIKIKIPSASRTSASAAGTPASASASASASSASASATAATAAAAAAAAATSGQQKPKRIKIITSQPEPANQSPSSGKPKIILNSPFPPSATAEKRAAMQEQEVKEEDDSTGLDYDGYTSSDSISDDRLHPNDWRLHQVKTRSFATHPGVTQYWHWVTEKQGDKKVIEHQVLESVQPIKWSVFKKPYNFHLKLGDIQEVSFARASTKVVVAHKKGRDGRDLGPRGHVMAQFKRDRTKRRFLTFLSRERGVKVGEVDGEEMEVMWNSLSPETLPGPDSD